jgi:hypothetical protein
VEDEPLCRKPCFERELKLSQRRHVGTETLVGKEPQERDVRERFRPVDDERLGVDLPVDVRPSGDRVAAVDDERCSEFVGERRRTDTADRELAALDCGCLWEEV